MRLADSDGSKDKRRRVHLFIDEQKLSWRGEKRQKKVWSSDSNLALERQGRRTANIFDYCFERFRRTGDKLGIIKRIWSDLWWAWQVGIEEICEPNYSVVRYETTKISHDDVVKLATDSINEFLEKGKFEALSKGIKDKLKINWE